MRKVGGNRDGRGLERKGQNRIKEEISKGIDMGRRAWVVEVWAWTLARVGA